MNDLSSLQGLLEAAQRIQGEVARVKAELASKSVSAETGGGLVSCTANGKGDLTGLSIDPTLLGGLQPEGKKMVEDLVVGAVNLALDRARQMAQDDLVRATGGLPLPPGLFGG
jgi:nucleoid-associated protein EbfC